MHKTSDGEKEGEELEKIRRIKISERRRGNGRIAKIFASPITRSYDCRMPTISRWRGLKYVMLSIPVLHVVLKTDENLTARKINFSAQKFQIQALSRPLCGLSLRKRGTEHFSTPVKGKFFRPEGHFGQEKILLYSRLNRGKSVGYREYGGAEPL